MKPEQKHKADTPTLPRWAYHFRRWGKPVDVARRVRCPVSVVIAAYNGDADAFNDLAAGRYGIRVNLACTAFHRMPDDDRRKRPRWMSRERWENIVNDVFPDALEPEPGTPAQG
jgi:hypothetical protein